MKRYALCCALAFALLAPATAEIKEQIVAVVNDDIITYSEIEKILSPIFSHYEQIYSGAELFSMLQKARRDVLEHLIQERLILQEAKALNIRTLMGDDFTKEVDRAITEIKRKFPSEEEFQKEMKREGSTAEEFRTQQEERTLVRAMLIKEVSSRCSVSPAEVKEYHAAHQSEFTEGEKAHVSQIWIKEMPEKPGEAERLSKELLNRLNNGERFPDLAKKYSQCPYAAGGGDWGVVGRGHLNKEIEDAAFSLSPGGHSGVIKTGLGYHIVMLHERKPPVVTPLEKVYAEIENKIFADKVTARRDEWIKKLKKKAYISVVK